MNDNFLDWLCKSPYNGSFTNRATALPCGNWRPILAEARISCRDVFLWTT